MPNFDAWRSAIIGPMAYLCKPQKPAELYLLMPCQYNINDISRYSHTITNTLGTATYATAPFGVGANNLQFRIDLPEIFTLEFFATMRDTELNASSFQVVFQENRFYSNRWNSDFQFMRGLPSSGSYTAWTRVGAYTDFIHFAFVKSSGKIKAFFQGAIWQEWDENGTTGCSITSTTTAINNLRIVAKDMTVNGKIIVPSSLYTGYEPL